MPMQFEANVISKSIGKENGVMVGTIEVVYPRVILAEVNTHRVISKNGASSRAIPFAAMIKYLRENSFSPLQWLVNKPGMSTTEVMGPQDSAECQAIWLEAMEDAIRHATRLNDLHCSKQYMNRLLEPFMMTRTLLTSTRWENFYKLRDHGDAMPEFQHLAAMMGEAMRSAPAVERSCDDPIGGWHRPYTDEIDLDTATTYAFGGGVEPKIRETNWAPTMNLGIKTLLTMSVARCCRVSGKTFAKEHPDLDADFRTFARLNSNPLHASPMEHQCFPLPTRAFAPWLTGNLHGFSQLRKLMPNEASEEASFVSNFPSINVN